MGMDTAQQTATESQQPAKTEADSVAALKLLDYRQDQYITFCASSGISMTEDGEFVVMTVTQFAQAAGVNRVTLYKWQKSIPDFWQRVDQRAREIFNQSTKYAIFKGLKLKAMAGDVKAAEMVLSHYSDYTPPAQKHEVKLSGWGDMVREARKRKIKSNRPAQEAELVEPPPIEPLADPNPQVPLPAPQQPPEQLRPQLAPHLSPPGPATVVRVVIPAQPVVP